MAAAGSWSDRIAGSGYFVHRWLACKCAAGALRRFSRLLSPQQRAKLLSESQLAVPRVKHSIRQCTFLQPAGSAGEAELPPLVDVKRVGMPQAPAPRGQPCWQEQHTRRRTLTWTSSEI